MNPETPKTNSRCGQRLRAFLRSRWLWCVVILLVVAVGGRAIHRAMQPKYKGKTAEEWFALIQIREPGEPRRKTTVKLVDRAVNALAAMEGDVIRLLQEKYAQRDSALKAKSISLMEKLSRGNVLLETEQERKLRISFVIQAMGAKADALVPVLLQGAKAGHEEDKTYAVVCLGDIGTRPAEALPLIVDVLSSSSSWNRALALHSMSQYAQHASVALPLLEQQMVSTNAILRVCAVRGMVEFGETNKAYNLMLREILDTNSPARIEAVQMLHIFGTNAVSAIPMLHDLVVTSSDAKLKDAVFRQIKKIDPEARFHNR